MLWVSSESLSSMPWRASSTMAPRCSSEGGWRSVTAASAAIQWRMSPWRRRENSLLSARDAFMAATPTARDAMATTKCLRPERRSRHAILHDIHESLCLRAIIGKCVLSHEMEGYHAPWPGSDAAVLNNR